MTGEERVLIGAPRLKGYAFDQVGQAYEFGKNGKKRNLKKALQCYKKGAELGFSVAQSRMSMIYYFGKFHEMPIPKNREKAMELAQKGVDQGNPRAQVTLGHLLSKYKIGPNATAEESRRLYSLAAYQEGINGMLEPETFYQAPQVQTRQDRLLFLY